MKNANKLSLFVAGLALVATTAGTFALAQTAPPPDTTGTATNSDSNAFPPQGGHDRGSHIGKNGMREELLTGDTAEKAQAAALKSQPGGTIDRLETDAEGAKYEAHMTAADGSRITLKLDENFNVTGTETGSGRGM